MNLTLRNARGFTLIELLIVIAIILILIAIALPNFLEAQIRARVAGARADMRSIGTAMESYFIDFGNYPMDFEPEPSSDDIGLYQLTSPIAYITAVPEDRFSTSSGVLAGSGVELGWELASTGADPRRFRSLGWNTQDNCKVHAWALQSSGPDTGSALGGGSGGSDEFWGNGDWPFLGRTLACPPSQQGWMTYSPTNGSKSRGDLLLPGGEHRSGRYCIDQWNLVSGHYPSHLN